MRLKINLDAAMESYSCGRLRFIAERLITTHDNDMMLADLGLQHKRLLTKLLANLFIKHSENEKAVVKVFPKMNS